MRTRWRARLALAALAVMTLGSLARAHEVRPALLQITEPATGDCEVLWKQPTVGDMAVHLAPRVTGGALDGPPASRTAAPGFLVTLWRTPCARLDGRTITIEGLDASVTDVLVRIAPAKGSAQNAVIRPGRPTLDLVLSGPRGLAVPAYLRMGIEHILTGFDHLLFVLGLYLLVGPNLRLLKAVSAFTLAHSMTLGLAALGYVRFPAATIEALVALSIVFVACELASADPNRLARRRPWLVAFAFGLLHGLAFAGALSEVGLPHGAELSALFLFNLGVEIGQIAFIAGVLAVTTALSQLKALGPWLARPAVKAAPAYVIGTLAAYWLIERLTVAVG